MRSVSVARACSTARPVATERTLALQSMVRTPPVRIRDPAVAPWGTLQFVMGEEARQPFGNRAGIHILERVGRLRHD